MASGLETGQGGKEVLEILDMFKSEKERLDVLMVEGTIYHGPKGTGKYFMFHDRPFRNWILDLAKVAHYTMAIGTCSSRLDRRNSHWSNFGKTRHCRAR